MNRVSKFTLSVAIVACIAGTAAPLFAATRGSASTVGDLLVGIASLKNLPAADANVAAAALRSAGYDLPRLHPTKPLTEGDVAAVASAVGLRVASSSPTRSFTASQVDQFLMAMRPALQGGAAPIGARQTSGGSDDDDDDDDQGKKKPRSKSPKNPDRESTPLK